MLSRRTALARTGLGALCAACLVASPVLAKARPSQRAGHIPNKLVDTLVDEPLHGAESIFDVYQVMVTWLKQVYPAESESGKALAGFDDFVKKFREMDKANGDKGKFDGANTVEMPMNIDQLVRLLRSEAPGVKGAFRGEVAQNVKAQVFTSLLLPFLQARGLTYRIRPLVEKSFVAHSAAINSLRALKNELEANGGKNSLALFNFVTYPLAQKGRTSIQFHEISELQAWASEQLIPTLDVSIAIAENALKTAKEGALESLDLSVFLKSDNPFPDPSVETAYRTAGKAELQNLIAGLYAARAGLHAFCAYELDDLSEATNTFAKVHMNNFLKEKVSFGKKPRIGTPSYIRYQIYKDQAKLFTLKDGSRGPAALADLRQAWNYYEQAMAGFFSGQPKADRMVSLGYIHASHRDFETKIAPQIRAVLAGPATLTDYFGGGSVDIDLPGILSSLPQDLKGFFPVKFNQDKPYREFEFSSGRLAYSNYDFGNPIGWDEASAGATWKKLFPNLPDARGADGGWIAPMKAYRDIQRTYVGPFLTPLMVSVID